MESLARYGIGVCFAAGTLIFPVFSAELDKRKESATTLMDVLTSPFLWLMSLGYFVVFCAKTSTIDWGQLYLMKDLKRSQFAGSTLISCIESGGVFGGILAGCIADVFFHTCKASFLRKNLWASSFATILVSSLAGQQQQNQP